MKDEIILMHDGAISTGLPLGVTGGNMQGYVYVQSGALAGKWYNGTTWGNVYATFAVPWNAELQMYYRSIGTQGEGEYVSRALPGTTGAPTAGIPMMALVWPLDDHSLTETYDLLNSGEISTKDCASATMASDQWDPLNAAAVILQSGSAGLGTTGVNLAPGQSISASNMVAAAPTAAAVAAAVAGTTITISAAQFLAIGLAVSGNTAGTLGAGIDAIYGAVSGGMSLGSAVSVGDFVGSAATVMGGLSGGFGVWQYDVSCETSAGNPIVGATVWLTDTAGDMLVSYGISDGQGDVGLTHNGGNHKVVVAKPGQYVFEGSGAVVNLPAANTTGTFVGTPFDPGVAPTINSCQVAIVAVTAGGAYGVGLIFDARLVGKYAIVGTGGDALEMQITASCTTGTNGTAVISLTRQQKYIMTSRDNRFEAQYTVPNAATDNLAVTLGS